MTEHTRPHTPPRSACPELERLAEYAEGVLDEAGRQEIERHLVDCPDCRAVLSETMAFLGAEPAEDIGPAPARVVPFRGRGWIVGAASGLAAAAALVLVIRLARPSVFDAWFGPRSDRPELQELVAALANEPTRPVEGRLTGGFKYAPPPSPTRGSSQPRRLSSDTEYEIAKATARVQSRDDAAARATSGRIALISGQTDRAIAELEDSARRNPQNAAVHSDLSAAYLDRARFGTHPEDARRALEMADRAVELDPRLLEARFNRALALERLKREQARGGWEEYLRLDPNGPWAAEARQHLAALASARAVEPMQFRPVTELSSGTPPPFSIQAQILVNLGEKSDDFPASFWGTLDGQPCSATLIGPSVLLTAAHCLSHPRERIVLVDTKGQPHSGLCDRAPGAKDDAEPFEQDWALCKMDTAPQVLVESVNTNPKVVGWLSRVLITGFGCDFRHGIKRPFTVFEVGHMRVTDVKFKKTDLFRAKSLWGTSLCPGDSGGGTYAPVSGGRVEVAVNSWTDLKRTSMMSSLSSAAGTAFLLDWSACSQVKICGVDPDATSCRLETFPKGNATRPATPTSCPPEWQ